MPDYFLLRLPLKTIIIYDVMHLTKEEYFVVEKLPRVIYKMRWAYRATNNVAGHFIFCHRWIWKRNSEGTMWLLTWVWHGQTVKNCMFHQ